MINIDETIKDFMKMGWQYCSYWPLAKRHFLERGGVVIVLNSSGKMRPATRSEIKQL